MFILKSLSDVFYFPLFLILSLTVFESGFAQSPPVLKPIKTPPQIFTAQQLTKSIHSAGLRLNPKIQFFQPVVSAFRKSVPKAPIKKLVPSLDKNASLKAMGDLQARTQGNPEMLQSLLYSAFYANHKSQLAGIKKAGAKKYKVKQISFGGVDLKSNAVTYQLNPGILNAIEGSAPAGSYSPDSVETVPVDLLPTQWSEINSPAICIQGAAYMSTGSNWNPPLSFSGQSQPASFVNSPLAASAGISNAPVISVPSTAVIFSVFCRYIDDSSIDTVGQYFNGNYGHYEMKVQTMEFDFLGTPVLDNTGNVIWNDASGVRQLNLCGPTAASDTLLPYNDNPPAPVNGATQGVLPSTAYFNYPANLVRIAYRYYLGNANNAYSTPANSPGVIGGGYQFEAIMPASWNGSTADTTDWIYSNPFEVDVTPSELIQLKYLPLAILYAPPGNSSAATFTNSNSISNVISLDQGLGNQFQNGNSTSHTVQNLSQFGFQSSAPVLGGAAVGGSTQGTQEWDFTTTQTKTATNDTLDSMTSVFGTTISFFYTALNVPGNDKETVLQEPFWSDLFILITHPQFAIWNYAPVTPADGPALNEVTMISSNASYFPSINVAELADCATGGAGPCVFTDNNPAFIDNLYAYDCQQFLELDPFYVDQWQGWPGSVWNAAQAKYEFVTNTGGRACTIGAFNTATEKGGQFYGVDVGQVLKNEVDQTNSFETNYNGTVESQYKTTMNSDGTIGINQEKFGISTTNGQSTSNTASLLVNEKAAATNGAVTEIEVGGQVGDTEGPINFFAYRDLVFKGVMFQDINETAPFKPASIPILKKQPYKINLPAN
jgi:hypothetical protein